MNRADHRPERGQPCPREPQKWNSRTWLFTLLSSLGSGLVGLPVLARADTATNAADEIGVPELLPPYPELPPSFWERHGITVVLLTIVGLLIVAAVVWLLRRRKPEVQLPPEVLARRALEALRAKPETGEVLSQISTVLRNYFRAGFELPREELTTTEFCQMISGHEKIGAQLAAAVSDFLRECDERKFSTKTAEPLSAAARALELVGLGETRRAQLAGAPRT